VWLLSSPEAAIDTNKPNMRGSVFLNSLGENLKAIHLLSIACLLVAIGLFFSGASKFAGLVFCLSVVVEIVGSAITGKKKNDGTR
jgi:hypothetical protein